MNGGFQIGPFQTDFQQTSVATLAYLDYEVTTSFVGPVLNTNLFVFQEKEQSFVVDPIEDFFESNATEKVTFH